ncbi:probable WRKY transcription factor 4 isoform X2 [Neltuma alba]|uniref:probable WRKY transcription factor 4 isoform X2 n=1 Tax=Neltuma alba TaxID=207710 RepID=UPI0010A590DC|nr:probable WRKY transcription factor 4 isoform X2 [Prosopis alba]
MGGIGDQLPLSSAPAKTGPPPPPSINPPPRTSMDALFNGGSSGSAGFGFSSPGPMTLVSNFFNDNEDFKSFSQLLAGAMPSPLMTTHGKHSVEVGGSAGTGLKKDRPSVEQSPMFMFPPAGLSAAGFVGPPRNFPASEVNENPSSSIGKQVQMMPPSSGTTSSAMKECPDDGFNWRKYGQKQVKGSEFPRSYYKCTYQNCPVKKKVERSLDDDHVVAIIYKGQHNHQRPRPINNNKYAKDAIIGTTTSDENSNARGTTWESSTGAEHEAEGSSESTEEAAAGYYGDTTTEMEDKNDGPDLKRRHTEGGASHRTAMEPRIIVQTTSEVDLLDDGYRWRKYGQKVVKGNPFPRSYYKCTTTGCNVRKHVERASSDPKAVITTYEGKHNHDVPAAKTNSHTIANNSASQLRPHNTTIPERLSFNGGPIGSHQQQQPVARLRLKEEQIT